MTQFSKKNEQSKCDPEYATLALLFKKKCTDKKKKVKKGFL